MKHTNQALKLETFEDFFKNYEIAIGAKLKELRLERDMTMQQVADAAGITKSSYAKAEWGYNKTGVSLMVFLRICQGLQVHGYDVLPDEDLLFLQRQQKGSAV